MTGLLILGMLVTAGISFFLLRRSQKFSDISRQMSLAVAALLVLSLGAECTLFNLNFYTSAGNNPLPLNSYLGEEASCEGGYLFNSSHNTIELSDIQLDLKNLYIDLADTGNRSTVDVQLLLTDEGNQYAYSVPVRRLCPDVEKSQYINLHTLGKSRDLSISFDLSGDDALLLTGLWANVERPFSFDFLRVLVLFGGLLLLWLFRPGSPLYQRKLEQGDLRKSLTGAFLCLQIAVILILGSVNPTFMGIASKSYNTYKWDGSGIDLVPLEMENHNQYDELAQALLQGKLYIDHDDVPDSLKMLSNPYDTALRAHAAENTGDHYRWDVAYYAGHYYVYFGIVPELLFYLPCRVLTGSPFPTAVGIMLLGVLFTLGGWFLLRRLCLRFFPDTSLGAFVLIALTFVNASGAMFLVKRPDFYSVPILMGMTFTVWGLYCWLRGLSEGTEKPRVWFLLGAVCMALVAGCRPQLILVSLLALPLFWRHFFRDKRILKKEGLLDLLVLALPYLAVAGGVMAYNYLRFKSPFDFGSAYNLTTNDVTRRGFDFGRIGLGIFTYLFQTPVFTAVFPFLSKAAIHTDYAGRTISENCFGGLITCLPMLWFLAALPRVRETLKGKKLWLFTLLTLIIGVIIVIADTEAGGLLQRYYSDFGFLFFLGAGIVIFALLHGAKTPRETKTYISLLFFSAFFSIFYASLLAISVSDVTIDTQNPTLFEYLSHAVRFWL